MDFIALTSWIFVSVGYGSVDECQDILASERTPESVSALFRAAEKTEEPRIARGSLTSDWNADLIGMDAVEVRGARNSVTMGVVDEGFKSGGHGHSVESVAEDLGIGSGNFQEISMEALQSESFLSQFGNRLPRVVNISYSLGSGGKESTLRKNIQAMRDRGVIIVVSSGNDGDKTISQNTQDLDLIVVGSVGSHGLASDYSQSGQSVDLLAPADYQIQIDTGNGQKASYMGTSFAAPQVAAVIARMLEVTPDLTQAEAEAILKFSSLKTINSAEPKSTNGAGSLNATKAIEIAQMVRDNPSLRSGILLGAPALYQADGLKQKSNQAFLAAQQTTDAVEKNRLLRRAFLLDQNNRDAQTMLVEDYKTRGLSGMAQFFGSINLSDSERTTYLSSLARTGDESTRRAAARTLAALDGKGVGGLKTMLAGNLEDKTLAIKAMILQTAGSHIGLLPEIKQISEPEMESWKFLAESRLKNLTQPAQFVVEASQKADGYADNSSPAKRARAFDVLSVFVPKRDRSLSDGVLYRLAIESSQHKNLTNTLNRLAKDPVLSVRTRARVMQLDFLREGLGDESVWKSLNSDDTAEELRVGLQGEFALQISEPYLALIRWTKSPDSKRNLFTALAELTGLFSKEQVRGRLLEQIKSEDPLVVQAAKKALEILNQSS